MTFFIKPIFLMVFCDFKKADHSSSKHLSNVKIISQKSNGTPTQKVNVALHKKPPMTVHKQKISQ